MPRLFVAVDIPADIKKRLVGLQTSIPTARWVKPEQLHITLRFIGDNVPAIRVKPIGAALAQVKAAPFDVTLGGVGRFPPGNRKAPRVLWVGISRQPALHDLYRQIETAVCALGFEPDERGFSPHITLARLKTFKPLQEADVFLDRHAAFDAGTFRVSRFVLYSSVLSPQGPTYTPLEIVELDGT